MDDGSNTVAIVSAAVAGLSLLVASGSLWFARRADTRAERAERRAERGQPSARYLGSVDKSQRGDTVEFIAFKFRITNVGAAGARHITVHLRDQRGVEVGKRSSGVSLPAGESDVVRVEVHNPTGYLYPLKVRLEWRHWEPDPERPELYTHDSSVVVPDEFLAQSP